MCIIASSTTLCVKPVADAMEEIMWTSDVVVAGRMRRCDEDDDMRDADDDDVVFNTFNVTTDNEWQL